MQIAGSTALVTGASSGIGAALCRALVTAGGSVALVARRRNALEALAASLPSGRAVPFVCDVRDAKAVAAMVTAARTHFGRLDLLVNNAGIGRYRPFLETGPEDVSAILETNLMGVWHCMQSVLPDMLAAGHGHVVNVASISSRIGSRNHTAYCASKFALAGLSESLDYELSGTGVGLTLVNPGIIATAFFDHESFAGFPAGARARAIAPERVADAIVRAVERGAREITVPRAYALGTIFKTIAPGLFRRLMRHQT